MTGDASPVSIERIVAGAWDENCYVVSAGADAVVVDPGGRAEAIAEHIARKRLHVHAVLATHGHHDHVGAVGELVEFHDAPFGVHSADARLLTRVNFCRSVFHGLGRVDLPPIGLDLADAHVPLRFGALELAVVHTPGHTPGSVCLATGGALLTGDTLMASEIGSTDIRGADAAALESSVRRLARDFGPTTAIHPGHGPTGTLGEALRAAGELRSSA
jgi:glyoxylase-like metal-dependent hydrolase (beta-lactamase superfamily II)